MDSLCLKEEEPQHLHPMYKYKTVICRTRSGIRQVSEYSWGIFAKSVMAEKVVFLLNGFLRVNNGPTEEVEHEVWREGSFSVRRSCAIVTYQASPILFP